MLKSRAMSVLSFDGRKPRLGQGVFVAENATIIGDVEVGNDCSIWFGTVLRGDVNHIRIGSRTNIQDNCVLHVTHERWPTIVAEEVTIGHGAIVHGCTVADEVLIGMGAVILNHAQIGTGCLIAARALVTEGMQVPPNSVVMGIPGRIKPLRDDQLARIRRNAQSYVELKELYLKSSRAYLAD